LVAIRAARRPIDGVLLYASHSTRALWYGTHGAGLEASLAFSAEPTNTKIHRIVHQEGDIGGYTAQAEAWAELPAGDEAIPSQLTQTGSDGERYQKYVATTQGVMRVSIVAQAPYVFCETYGGFSQLVVYSGDLNARLRGRSGRHATIVHFHAQGDGILVGDVFPLVDKGLVHCSYSHQVST